ncbi:MAG: MerR family transcriptional regulator [Gammaproteobacteria bacterium]|nr:MAG: MerR family transcriptional regulator [Gammaproteobacteria bacterium]
MEATIPIREISRLTGVNSVTLRAWERRYGLIKPLRTNKGHRLYRAEDIELIKTIQAWLARGLAIGKVSELLESGSQSADMDIENTWQGFHVELMAIMSELNVGKLEAFFNQLFSIYPAAIIADQLITPALDNLSQNVFGSNVKKSILINRLSEYLLMLIQRQRQQANGKRVAIIQLTSAIDPTLNVLMHYGLVMSQFKSEIIGLVTANEVVFAIEQLQLDGLIIYNDSCSSLTNFERELAQLGHLVNIPLVIGGKLVQVLTADFSSHIYLASASGQQAVYLQLHKLLGNSSEEEL